MSLGGQEPRSPKHAKQFSCAIFEDPTYGSYRIDSMQPPAELKSMDWATAGEFYKGFAHTHGRLDKREFYRLMSSITRTLAPIDRNSCDRVFEAVNVDQSGLISEAEFLGWIFATCSDFDCISELKERLRQIGRKGMQAYFHNIHMHTPGLLDRNDFHAFVLRECRGFQGGTLSRRDCDEIFTYVDTDKSGSIDLEKFIDWVYPEQATIFQPPSPSSPSSPGLRAQNARSFLGRSAQNSAPTSPTSPGMTRAWSSPSLSSQAVSPSSGPLSRVDSLSQPEQRTVPTLAPLKDKVVLEFDVGPELNLPIPFGKLIKAYLPLQVRAQIQPRVNIMEGIRGCDRCIIWIGRGIVLWDQKRMQHLVEDHYQSQETVKRWVTSELSEKLPLLLGVAEKEKEIARQEVLKKYPGCR